MEVYILNKGLELQGIVENFISLIWRRKYHKVGEFELHLPATDDNILLMKKDYILYKKGDGEGAYIQTRQFDLNEKGNETLVIKGKFLTNYIGQRIIWERLTFRGSYEAAMRSIVNLNCITPEDIKRIIPHLMLGQLKGYIDTVIYNNSYGNCIEELENLSNTSGIGYRVNLDYKNKDLIFEVYKGVDRSSEQTAIAPVIFSKDFENVIKETFYDSKDNYKNTCLIAGAGEGTARKKSSIENGNGLDRYELYVDARDLADTENVNDVEVKINDVEYNAMLIQRGSEKLKEYEEIKTFDSTVNANGNNVYKADYDLGDIVTNIDKKWGVKVATRITEIEEVYEGGRVEINPTFGTNIPSILDSVKRMVR